jgi:hypothetical protein
MPPEQARALDLEPGFGRHPTLFTGSWLMRYCSR